MKKMLMATAVLALAARAVANAAGGVISANTQPLETKNPRTAAEQKLVDSSLPTNYNWYWLK